MPIFFICTISIVGDSYFNSVSVPRIFLKEFCHKISPCNGRIPLTPVKLAFQEEEKYAQGECERAECLNEGKSKVLGSLPSPKATSFIHRNFMVLLYELWGLYFNGLKSP